MAAEQTLEIPRDRSGNAWRLAGGAIAIVAAFGIVTGTPDVWPVAAGCGVFGVVVVLVNGWLLVAHRPQLRATSAGVWLGRGATIPWSAIGPIYEAGTQIKQYGYNVRTRAIAFALHRPRAVFRLPPSLWLPTFLLGTIRISVQAAEQSPMTLVCQLEAMRTAACGHEDGAIPGASDVPSARVVDRS